MANDPDRPRGMLTQTDRSFLRGEVEYEYKQQYSNRWANIRERIANGLLDFNEIQYSLRDKDRKLIFQKPGEAAGIEDPPFYNAIEAMIYWTYYGLREQRYDFEGMLTEVIKLAEEDFARKYWGETVDARIRFGVNLERTGDIDSIIKAIEKGGPVKAEAIYELLKVKDGVPIDTSELDMVQVWFSSSYPNGEKQVLDTLFSEYLGADVEIKDAEIRVDADHRESAVTDPNKSRSDPSKIEGRKSPLDFEESATNEYLERLGEGVPPGKRESSEPGESILDDVVEQQMKQAEEAPPSIHQFIGDQDPPDKQDQPVTPAAIQELLKEIREPFISTAEISAVFNCAPEAARQALSELWDNGDVKKRGVIVKDGTESDIWWLTN